MAVAAVHLNRRFWVETALAVLSAVLFVLTVFAPDCIEAVFGNDPDARSGSLEATIVRALAVTTFVSRVLAHREWCRSALIASGAR